jgi:hypothetical protein
MQYACLRIGARSVLVDAVEYFHLEAQKPIADEPDQEASSLVWKLVYGAFLVQPDEDPAKAVERLVSYKGCGFGRVTSEGTCRLALLRDIEIFDSWAGAGYPQFPCAVLLWTEDEIPPSWRFALTLFPRFVNEMDALSNTLNRPGVLAIKGEEKSARKFLNPEPPDGWRLLIKRDRALRTAARCR